MKIIFWYNLFLFNLFNNELGLVEKPESDIFSIIKEDNVWKIKEGTTDYSEKFGYFDRRELKWFFPEILDAILQNQ